MDLLTKWLSTGYPTINVLCQSKLNLVNIYNWVKTIKSVLTQLFICTEFDCQGVAQSCQTKLSLVNKYLKQRRESRLLYKAGFRYYYEVPLFLILLIKASENEPYKSLGVNKSIGGQIY